ncbi:hypothetical protein F0562_005543 [Nyssa sinensis]|uniref:Uncharacterized protein n=1 Tax=Nyssa sinensis TaxID=561372 RepID=A0A5J5AIH4_9ASTE|nr:hypothetical protein F0562_005543 [Nyssa sinensis]
MAVPPPPHVTDAIATTHVANTTNLVRVLCIDRSERDGQDHSDALKLDLGLSSGLGSSEVGSSHLKEEIEATDELYVAD